MAASFRGPFQGVELSSVRESEIQDSSSDVRTTHDRGSQMWELTTVGVKVVRVEDSRLVSYW